MRFFEFAVGGRRFEGRLTGRGVVLAEGRRAVPLELAALMKPPRGAWCIGLPPQGGISLHGLALDEMERLAEAFGLPVLGSPREPGPRPGRGFVHSPAFEALQRFAREHPWRWRLHTKTTAAWYQRIQSSLELPNG